MIHRRLSFARIFAILMKEFLQMRRDRITMGMIVGVPLMQLFVFGFAINFNPKDLPTAISIDDPGVFSRSIVAALHNSSYFKIVGETNSPVAARNPNAFHFAKKCFTALNDPLSRHQTTGE